MATKFFSDGAVHAYFNPYETPYDAFMNYMNVLSDFEIRVRRCFPTTDEQEQISKLDALVREKDKIIEQQAAEIEKLTKKPGKTTKRGRPAVNKEPHTSLKELAAKLAETSLKKPAVKKPARTLKSKAKTTKKAPAKKTPAKKSPAKKSNPKKSVKRVSKTKK
jgi:alpha-amylase